MSQIDKVAWSDSTASQNQTFVSGTGKPFTHWYTYAGGILPSMGSGIHGEDGVTEKVGIVSLVVVVVAVVDILSGNERSQQHNARSATTMVFPSCLSASMVFVAMSCNCRSS